MGEKEVSNHRPKGYDKARDGYVRYTIYIEAELLRRFKEVAAVEQKSMIQAANEAVSNWIGEEE